jgi:DNA topoisomerase-1
LSARNTGTSPPSCRRRATESFEARLTAYDGKKLQKLDIKNKEQADGIKAMLNGATFRALSVEAKPTTTQPWPAFHHLDASAGRLLASWLFANRTMQVAQRLYEGLDIGGETAGLITYMRTDGVQIAPEAIEAARASIVKEFGDKYLPEKPRHYTTKAKNAQEAHEAIRPTDFSRLPQDVKKYLDADQARLYEMIWKRAIASQMNPAEIERTTVEIEAVNGGKAAGLRAVGSVIKFDGFIAAYTDQKDEDSEDEENKRLPQINSGEALKREQVNTTQHTTEPPPRYSEASLIKKMEELGIGRPSTYASTLKTLEDREYVVIDKRKLIPHSRGRIVTAFLESFFDKYVEYDFTAALEEKLDEISDGKLAYKDVLRDFWRDFSAAVANIKELRVTDVLNALNEDLAPLLFPARDDGSDPRTCPKCGVGTLSLRLGKYGAFVGCSNYPDCGYTRQLGDANNGDAEAAESSDKVLGKDPYTNEDITLRSGRFGPYVQRGEGKDAKRSSLPKGWTAESIDHEKALALLSLPRDVGKHPESGKMISAGLGRYGPFVLHDGAYANLESIEDVFSIGLNRAVSVIAEKQSKGPRAGRGTPAALKDLGAHPDGSGAVTVRDGRYGPYVNFGKINATLPKGKDPATVTMDEALALIAAKAEKDGAGGGKKPFKRGKKA